MDFVIDGNAYLNVAVSVVKSIMFRDKTIGAKYYVDDIFNDGEYMLKDQVKIRFRDFCLTYLHSLIAPVNRDIDRVHLVFDSKSWRRDFIKKFFTEDNFNTSIAPTTFTYKGNRKKDDKIHLFFEYFQDEIIPAFEKCGINYYRIDGTEGDDIIAYLCEKLKTDVLVYTVDGDIKQLTFTPDKNVIVIYPKQQRKHKLLCIPASLNLNFASEEEDDFFSLSESHIALPTTEKIINTLKNRDYVELTVDPVDQIFHDIFRGQKKDNIPKMDKMTPTKTTKMLDIIKGEYGSKAITLLDNLDETFINFVVKNISILNSINDIEKLKDIRKHFLFNARILRLSSKLFPQTIRESLDSGFDHSKLISFKFDEFTNLKNNPSLI